MMHHKRTKDSVVKQKLGRISSEVYENEEEDFYTMGQMVTPKNWKFAIVGCGSNAFGQIYADDVMCPTFQHIPLPLSKNSNCDIEQISAGSTISSAVLSKGGGLYFWGSSGSASYRTPLPMKIDPRCIVTQISCGESHSAFISQTGKVFTVGNGEHGALGHGNKTTLASPKVVSAMVKMTCLQVCCGPYHTAFIAGEDDDIGYVRIPPSAAPVNMYEEWEGSPGGRFDRVHDGLLVCARLFMCGIGKTGQLGLGDNTAMMKSPREVKWFSENGHRVGKVSCGMHHTVVIAIPVHAMRMFITTVFTFGWGEHGRLGHGNEFSCKIPTEVKFPEPFHAIDVSAGEQHTLATSGRDNGCYAWGNNGFGQCAAGSPSSTEFVLSPNKVPIPEGIRIVKVTAGGRHSAAISACEKLLLWGWGEEGQLGSGTEKDSWLPRPVRLPEVMGQKCLPMTVALGMCHTIVAVRNKNYVYSKAEDDVEVVEEDKEEEGACLQIVANITKQVDSTLSCALSPAPLLTDNVVRKQVSRVEESIEESKPIQSLKDILASREERESEREELQMVWGKYSSGPEPEREPEVVKSEEEETQELKSKIDEETFTINASHDDNRQPRKPPPSSKERHFDKYYYHEGQDLDNCFVANSARRAEIRKQKKSTPTPPPAPPAHGKRSAPSFPRRPSK